MIELKKRFVLRRSELGRKFRVENNNLDLSDIIETTGYDVARIGDIAPAHRNDRKKVETADSVFRYVQISDIDVELGRIKSFRSFRGDSAPNNARRIMREGDVLVSTRRPTRGAVVSVPAEFDAQICTVFFTSLRVVDRETVDPRYLALFLRTSLARYQFSSLITETAYPVISDDDVENMSILLPPIEVQRTLAQSFEFEVQSFFDRLNAAYAGIAGARDTLESAILLNHAEVSAVRRFGLVEEAEEEEVAEEPTPD
jgi:type I restriction enzyme S subunit